MKKFKVYSASAGSGKTFRLTVQYLIYALRKPNENYRRILAITFTKKATQEMKSRILEACHAISRAAVDPLAGRNLGIFKTLVAEMDLPEEEVIDRAGIVFKNILHNYSDFSVSTIDSFSNRIIKSFTYELGIPKNYMIEMDMFEIQNIVTDRLLSWVGRDDRITKMLQGFFMNKLKHKDSIDIRSTLLLSAKTMMRDDSIPYMQAIKKLSVEELSKIGKDIVATLTQLRKQLQEAADRAIDTIESHGMSLNDFSYTKSSFANTFYKIRDGKFDFPGKRFVQAEDPIKWFKKGDPPRPEIEDTVLASVCTINATMSEYLTYDFVNKSFPELILMGYLYDQYKLYQKEEDKMMISEFNRLISEEVREQPSPFIYEKIGQHFRYIMIDEFQDTSVLQWLNILPLVSEALNSEEDAECLVVGDGKQSIYRFRGGESRQLDMLPLVIGAEDNAYIAEHASVLHRSIDKERLSYNYRSKSEVIAFNNLFYDYIAQEPVFMDVRQSFEGAHQIDPNPGSGGYVHIQLIKDEEEDEETEVIDSRYEYVMDTITNAVERGFAYSDIAILGRNNKELIEVTSWLVEANIPIISRESLLLNNDPSVRLFMAIYAHFLAPEDQIKAATVLIYLVRMGIIKEEYHTLFTLLKNIDKEQGLSGLIRSYRSDIDLDRIHGMTLLEAWEKVASWIDPPSDMYYGFFREALFKHVTDNGDDFQLLIDWWQAKSSKLSVALSENMNGVRLLTLHKAKGLEFEIVIIPFADWNIRRVDPLWVDVQDTSVEGVEAVFGALTEKGSGILFPNQNSAKHQRITQDELNVLYVATTRPITELYLFSNQDDAPAKNLDCISNMKYLLSHFVQKHGNGVDAFSMGMPQQKKSTDEKASLLMESIALEKGRRANISIRSRSASIWNASIKNKIEEGLMVHAMLEEVYSIENISNVVNDAVHRGHILASEEERYIRLLDEVVGNDLLTSFYAKDARVLVERPIITPEGIEYIPDRVVIYDGKAEILDYKTGEQTDKHAKQLNRYAALIASMGYTVEQKYIVYIDPLTIVTVD